MAEPIRRPAPPMATGLNINGGRWLRRELDRKPHRCQPPMTPTGQEPMGNVGDIWICLVRVRGIICGRRWVVRRSSDGPRWARRWLPPLS